MPPGNDRLGKKNWLFSSSEEAGEHGVVIYTLVANCRPHGVEPYADLKDVLERLPTATNQTVDQLTPLNWKKPRQTRLKLAARVVSIWRAPFMLTVNLKS